MRKTQIEEEDAGALQFGSEFQNEQCLTISDVRFLLDVEKEKKGGEAGLTEVMQKTLKYTTRLSKFSNPDTLHSAKGVFSDRHSFEVAQLINLNVQTSEEAKSLIPSLSSMDDEMLQYKLDDVVAMKGYQN